MFSNEPTFSLDWAPDAIIVASVDRGVVHLNPRAESLFGYQRVEVAERPLQMLICEGLPDIEHRVALQQASRRIVCVHRDGTRFAAAVRWRPVPPEVGDYVIFSIREAGPANQADPRTSAVAEPEAEEVALDLLSLFEHDIRQSLQALQFTCDSIAEQVPDAAVTIGEIIGVVGRLLKRLTHAGNLSNLTPAREPCSLDTVLASLGRELTAVAARKGLRLSVDRSSEQFATDPVLFRELLHNLLCNAIRYTEAGEVAVRCRSSGAFVRIEISDTGGGIDPASVVGMVDGAGNGLGLVIVRLLAARLGCTVEVESSPGRGSCVTVVAPRNAV